MTWWTIGTLLLTNLFTIYIHVSHTPAGVVITSPTLLYLPSNPLRPHPIACASFQIIARIFTLQCFPKTLSCTILRKKKSPVNNFFPGESGKLHALLLCAVNVFFCIYCLSCMSLEGCISIGNIRISHGKWQKQAVLGHVPADVRSADLVLSTTCLTTHLVPCSLLSTMSLSSPS